jgi:hypothetical protein
MNALLRRAKRTGRLVAAGCDSLAACFALQHTGVRRNRDEVALRVIL